MSWSHIIKLLVGSTEEFLSRSLLSSPTFHRGVRRIHRTVEDLKYGRNSNEPLRPGEATTEPGRSDGRFLKYFVEELKNQAKGTPTEEPPASKSQIEVVKRWKKT